MILVRAAFGLAYYVNFIEANEESNEPTVWGSI